MRGATVCGGGLAGLRSAVVGADTAVLASVGSWQYQCSRGQYPAGQYTGIPTPGTHPACTTPGTPTLPALAVIVMHSHRDRQFGVDQGDPRGVKRIGYGDGYSGRTHHLTQARSLPCWEPACGPAVMLPLALHVRLVPYSTADWYIKYIINQTAVSESRIS